MEILSTVFNYNTLFLEYVAYVSGCFLGYIFCFVVGDDVTTLVCSCAIHYMYCDNNVKADFTKSAPFELIC